MTEKHIWDDRNAVPNFAIDRSIGRTEIVGCRHCLAIKITFKYYTKKRLPDGFKETIIQDPLTGACRDE